MDIHIEDDSTESGLVCMTAVNWVEMISEGAVPFHDKMILWQIAHLKLEIFRQCAYVSMGIRPNGNTPSE